MNSISESKVRYNILLIIIYAIGIILLVGLFNLQIIKGAEYREKSNNRLTRNSTIKAARGNILDSTGNKLVSTKMVYNLEMYRTKLSNEKLNQTVLKVIDTLLENGDSYIDDFPIKINPIEFTMEDPTNFKKVNKISENSNAEDVINFFVKKYEVSDTDINNIRKIVGFRYTIEKRGYSSTKPIVIASNISIASRDRFNVINPEFPGISTTNEARTDYKYGELASHILGYVQNINEEELKQHPDYDMNDKIGKTGIEKVFEKYLRGENGLKQIEMSVEGQVTDEYVVKEAISGNDVMLTLDLELQKKTEEALANGIKDIQVKNNSYEYAEGAAVAMNVQTGEILAMASYPNYNPALFEGGISNKDYQNYINDKSKPFINKAISDKSAPGSIFKMATAIAAFESGNLDLKTKINDTYRYTYYNDYQPTCWKRGGHGWLDITQAIEVSCNFFFYDIGRKTGIKAMNDASKKLGLGEKTGIELPDEIRGTLSGPEYDKVWTGGKTVQSAIGQLYNEFTPLQMAKYTSMIANGGKNIDVTIIKSVNKFDGTTISRNELDSHISEKLGETNSGADLSISQQNLNAIKEGMKNVTSDDSGTAYRYFKDFKISIGGKTGSASIGNSGHANAWFVGFGPFDDPKIAVAVYVKRGESGSYTAPIAREIFAQYLGMNAKEISENMSVDSQMEIVR